MRDHSWIVVFTVLLINVLSLIDGYFTVVVLELEIAYEGNPVLAAAIQDHGLMAAMIIKLGAMVIASTVIWFGREKRSILALAIVAVVLFGGVVAYHTGTLRGLGLL
ncbi:MAG: DUF5658 family protein [Coriobacteriia bacterium]|nr:DUF5658 family protein [Coriobacteriia bacterium]